MTKRRLLWILGLAAFLVALPFVLWAGYAAVAVFQGQHFYHGLPSSHWARAVRRAHREDKDRLSVGPVWLREALGLGGCPAILRPDPAAVPVLIDLFRDDEKKVRLSAALTIERIGPPAKAAVPALLEALLADREVARAVVTPLLSIKPPSEEVLPAILRLAESEFPDRRRLLAMLSELWIDSPQAPALLAQTLGEGSSVVYPSIDLAVTRLYEKNPAKVACLVPVLQEAARSEDKLMRELVTLILKEIGHEAAAP
jgi:HEAT repeat protein